MINVYPVTDDVSERLVGTVDLKYMLHAGITLSTSRQRSSSTRRRLVDTTAGQ